MVAITLAISGWVHSDLDILEEGQRLYWESLQSRLSHSIGSEGPIFAILMDLGSVCTAMGKHAMAERLFLRAFKASSVAKMPLDRQILSLLRLSDVFRANGNLMKGCCAAAERRHSIPPLRLNHGATNSQSGSIL